VTRGRHYVVIGGGIVGLAVAGRLVRDYPGARVSVLEKESRWALHQTGRNSGVIHSGLYYPPGSHKASMCRRGSQALWRFADEEGVPVDRCGKLVVATDAGQVGALRALAARGRANGLAVRELDPLAAAEYEPNVACTAALHVPETGIIDYSAVCAALARRLVDAEANLKLGVRVVGLREHANSVVVETTADSLTADVVLNCAGLHSDEIARLSGARPSARIIPFRGEYYDLTGPSRTLIRSLIYPVPDPRLPFLGVHLTRTIDGRAHAGPNAVLALAREGYDWRTVRWGDLARTLTYPGFWRLAARHAATGVTEVRRSLSRRRFAESLRTMVPDVRDEDLTPAPAGVRAQAVRPDGSLVDDFLIDRSGRIIHVLNAPSPAATAALEIAAHIAGLVAEIER
jgi:L-2-hydroxyglutarate oxidase